MIRNKGVAAWAKIGASTFLALMLGRVAGAQTFNVYEGLGVLENAWQDWSNSSDNFQSGSYVYEGSYSAEVQFTSGGQVFRLVSPNSFPAAFLSGLSFNVNGGGTRGRAVSVALVVNGSQSTVVNLNSYIAGGSVPSNAYAAVNIPLSAFGVTTTDSVSEIRLIEASGSAQPAFWIGKIGWTAATPPSPVAITVNAQSNLKTVDPKMFGVNTAVWDGNFTSNTCRSLISQAGYKAFRFPGGSLSDGYHWATNTTDSNTWTWATNFDQFASVATSATAGQCFITTNYGTGSAAEAAAWVKYSNITHHYGMKFWEVGNECYGGWEEDAHTRPQDPVIYAQQYAQYYAAMKAVDPTIKVGAVATPGEDGYANYWDEAVTNPRTLQQHAGWTPVMLATLAGLGVTPDFIIYHRYPEYVVDCDFTLLTGNGGWGADIANMRQQLQDYLGLNNTYTQIMCTENNADAGTPGKQLCSLVNGLHLADSFGAVLDSECVSYMWWDLINGTSTNPTDGPWLYGWRQYGDEGMFSPDFTQTYPIFYAEQMVNLFAAPRDTVLSATSSYGLLSVYATKRWDGSVRLLVVNKNPTVQLTGHIAFAGFVPSGAATQYLYGMKQDSAAQAGRSQAPAGTRINTGEPMATASFPPYSITVLQFESLGLHPATSTRTTR